MALLPVPPPWCCRPFLAGVVAEALAQPVPQAPVVAVASPVAKRITTWDEYSGRFTAVDSVEVRPRVSGFVDQVHFKDGQIVKAGDLLFTIDPRPFRISVEAAQAEVARTKSQMALAQNEVERVRPLVRSGAVTEREFDQRSASLNVARAQLQAAEAALKSAELDLEWSTVRAPIAGRVSDKRIDVGNLVTGGENGATVLTTVVSLDPIHFEFEISETDFLRYARLFLSGARASSREAANPVRIKLADEPNWPHTGKMDFVDNTLNPRSGTLRGRAVVDNANQFLQPGLFGRLQLFGGETDAMLIPDSAIVSDQARKIVFVVDDDGVIRPVPVELGPIHEGLRVIRAGLEADHSVVIDGIANPAVRPGAKVIPQESGIRPVASN
jgi:RND family efflux transporter MFP subunit